MKGKLVFVAGAALGYVLGTRAGRKRYEQIKSNAQKVWNSDPVQKGVEQVQTFVDDHVPDVPTVLADGAKKVFDGVASRTKKSDSTAKSDSAASSEPSPSI
jgi:oxygen-dependent protoporphyrinogen oxidase